MKKIQHQELYRIYTIWVKPVLGQLNVTQKEDKVQAKILKKYLKFLLMLRKEAHEKLPEYRDWDYKIPIKEAKKPTYSPIYAL